jgi:hypothetical protein
MLRARWAMLRARWVTLRARWVTLRARWPTTISGWSDCSEQRFAREEKSAATCETVLTVAVWWGCAAQDVLLFIDNIFRFTQANSEVSAGILV